jgi:hypothetical protein
MGLDLIQQLYSPTSLTRITSLTSPLASFTAARVAPCIASEQGLLLQSFI